MENCTVLKILQYCNTVWGPLYCLYPDGAIWERDDDGPHFDSPQDALEALRDYLSPENYERLKERLAQEA